MSKTPAWLQEMWMHQASSFSGRDAFCWGVHDGDASFAGEEGHDLVWLDGFTLIELRGGLKLADPAMRVRIEGNGMVSFRDADGLPAPADGVLTIRKATLRFTGVMRFAFLC